MTLRSVDAIQNILASYDEGVICVVGLGRTAALVEREARGPVLALDAMGCIVGVAAGIAIGLSPDTRVVAFDTDGSLLLEIGGLAALVSAVSAKKPFDLYVMDNGVYESGGGAPSRMYPLDWVQLFGAFGLEVSMLGDWNQLSEFLRTPYATRTNCAVVTVENHDVPGSPASPYDGREKVSRFCDGVLQLEGRARWPRASKL